MRNAVVTRLRRAALAALALAAIAGVAQAQAQTLAAVKQRGAVNCGVNPGLQGFALADGKGAWSGLDVDFCRALAAAIFGDPNKVNFTPLSAEARFEALKDGKIDVLARNSTWTMGRETQYGLVFVGVNYYDGQGFLVRKEPPVASALDLGGAKVCVQTGTTTIGNFEDYFKSNNLKYEVVGEGSSADALKDYEAGKCSVYTTDVSGLYAQRLALQKPADSVILPDIISKEPLGPVVRQGDAQWAEIVKWTLFAMIDAEELGVSSKTLETALHSAKPPVRRLVGAEGDFGKQLGLADDWAVNIVRAVGNYGESYERNVGANSPLGIPRGLNELWSLGGILYAPPIR